MWVVFMSGSGLTPQSVAESFGPGLLDEDACRTWVVGVTRGSEPVCPYCGARFQAVDISRINEGRIVLCPSCDRHSSPRTGTILAGSSLTNAQVVFILAMLHWEINAATIADMAGCGVRTVYDWRSRMRGDL